MLTAMHYDLVRSLKKDTPWMVMEQTTFRVNWRPVNVAKAPGEMRAGSYQALARGSTGIGFFQWRAARAGAEKFHSAMLPHAGTASGIWREVTGLGAELRRLAVPAAARVAADVAIAFSWPNWWALELGSKPSAEIQMLDQVRWMYRPVFEAGLTADFAAPDEDLSGYPLVLVPSLYLLTEAEGRNIRRYVADGGTAVISFWSGIVNSADQVYPGSYGGPLGELFGGAVLDVTPLPPGAVAEVAWRDGRQCTATHWLDIIEPAEGTVLASYAFDALGLLPGCAGVAARRGPGDLPGHPAGPRRHDRAAGRPAGRPGHRQPGQHQPGRRQSGQHQPAARRRGAGSPPGRAGEL